MLVSFLAPTTWGNRLVDLVAFAGLVALSAIWHRIRWQVNGVLPPDRRLRLLHWSWEGLEFYSLHKEFYPESRLRLAHNIILVIWSPFGIVGYWRLLQAIDAWLAR